MAEYIARKKFFRTNKYQRQVLSVSLVPLTLICIGITAFILYFHKALIEMILFSTEPVSVRVLNKWYIAILAGLWGFFLYVFVRVFTISSNLMGAFERILKELDDVITGNKRKLMKARQKDDLVNELLKRINFLIEHQKDVKKDDSTAQRGPGRF